MRIEIEARSGFCSGVKHAIEKAEDALRQGEELFCLGQIVHNEEEEKRLQGLGMQQLEHGQLDSFQGKRVLLRAHGEPPETFQKLQEKNIRLIDATCPVVIKLQKRVKKALEEMPGAQILIYGKAGHPEVIGLEGQTGYRAIVVGDEAKDLEEINLLKPVVLFSQTTKSLEGFWALTERIREGMQRLGADPDILLTVNDTICRQVSNRGPAIKKFAQSHDVIIFVSGAKSSNGRYLYGLCREVNPKTYMVGSERDLQKEWFEDIQCVGISGATSTPRWQLERLAEAIKNLI